MEHSADRGFLLRRQGVEMNSERHRENQAKKRQLEKKKGAAAPGRGRKRRERLGSADMLSGNLNNVKLNTGFQNYSPGKAGQGRAIVRTKACLSVVRNFKMSEKNDYSVSLTNAKYQKHSRYNEKVTASGDRTQEIGLSDGRSGLFFRRKVFQMSTLSRNFTDSIHDST